MPRDFHARKDALISAQQSLFERKNRPQTEWSGAGGVDGPSNGIFQRMVDPVICRHHVPLTWRYDFDQARNPMLLERLGINATFNAGAMMVGGKHAVMVRVEGNDRKSFFALAESETGIDGFKFRAKPVLLPQTEDRDTNVYDMRLVAHEDGWVYGLFCAERKDVTRPNDLSAAVATCGIARTKDLDNWTRLPDLISTAGQQRNVVLHPEFIDGRYMLYTRPQDGFIDVGGGGGIGFGFVEDMTNPVLKDEKVMEGRAYHTIKELKNGQGPAPIKTEKGWLHLAHGVRNTAAGLRYVLYMFMTDLNAPWKVTHAPGGHFMAPEGSERLGDVSNVLFTNGWIARPDGSVAIYYASSDTRLHVALSSVAQLVDYVTGTPPDALYSDGSVQQRLDLIAANEKSGAVGF